MNTRIYVVGSLAEQLALRTYIRETKDIPSRDRAQAILWSMEGGDRKEIAALFKVKADTISDWFKRWDSNDLSKLANGKRTGRPPLLTQAEKKTF